MALKTSLEKREQAESSADHTFVVNMSIQRQYATSLLHCTIDDLFKGILLSEGK